MKKLVYYQSNKQKKHEKGKNELKFVFKEIKIKDKNLCFVAFLFISLIF